MQKSVVICGYKRSPFHFANKGDLAKFRTDYIGAMVVKALLESTGASQDDIEDLIIGCAFP
ncbi:MAG: acetyl-CoA C-acyltransferase, partial [Pseudomonadota bacterium]|nr:acetyl-CoA C-acyltransferase [Pseudomonadota bacterium]